MATNFDVIFDEAIRKNLFSGKKDFDEIETLQELKPRYENSFNNWLDKRSVKNLTSFDNNNVVQQPTIELFYEYLQKAPARFIKLTETRTTKISKLTQLYWWEEKAKDITKFEQIKNEIEVFGYFILVVTVADKRVFSVKLFNPELAWFFGSEKVKAFYHDDRKKDFYLNGNECLNPFLIGIKEGEKEFEEKHQLSANDKDKFIASPVLYREFIDNMFYGWHGNNSSIVQNAYGLNGITYNDIKTFGRNTGIFTKVLDTTKNYPELYKQFFNVLPLHIVEALEVNKIPKGKRADDLKLSIPQTAILCSIMEIEITAQNADEILKQHSEYKSGRKLVQERINKQSSLTAIRENKTADTKRKNNLLAVKQYISSTKNRTALDSISRIITAFETNYNNFYTV